MTINEINLKKVILQGYLPLPLSVIPPERPFPLWRSVPEPRRSDEEFLQILQTSVEKSVQDIEGKIGVWFSGGIDSSILLYLVSKVLDPKKIVAYTLDFGCYPDEMERVDLVKDELGLCVVIKRFSLEDHFRLLEKSIINARQPVDFSTQVIEAGNMASSDGCETVLSALGLDEIQSGYPKHVVASDEKFPEIERQLLEVCQSNYVWSNICQAGIEVRFPFLSPLVISYGRALPRDQKNKDDETKILLRRSLSGKLPKDIVEAGKFVGTKRGFTPLITTWWKEGLEDWVMDEIKTLPISSLSLAIRPFIVNKIFSRGNLWRLIRLASLPTFYHLYNQGKFQ